MRGPGAEGSWENVMNRPLVKQKIRNLKKNQRPTEKLLGRSCRFSYRMICETTDNQEDSNYSSTEKLRE